MYVCKKGQQGFLMIQKVKWAVNTEREACLHVDQNMKVHVSTSGSYIINHPENITLHINLISMQILRPTCELYLMYKLFMTDRWSLLI